MPRNEGAAAQGSAGKATFADRSPWVGRRRDSLAVLRVVHPFPSFLVALVAVALVPLTDSEAPLDRYLTLGLGMLLFQFTIGLVNDIVDLASDGVAKPWKPLVRGAISRRTAVLVAIGLGSAGLLLTLRLPLEAWLVGVLGLGLGIAYDVYFKRTVLSWLPFAIAFPLVPIWVYLAAEAWDARLWWTLPLGASLGFGLHLANQAPDAADDIGLPGVLGEQRSRQLATVVFTGVALTAALVLLPDSRGHALAAASTGVIVLAASPWAPRVLGRDALFGLHALGAAALALVFLSAISAIRRGWV